MGALGPVGVKILAWLPKKWIRSGHINKSISLS